MGDEIAVMTIDGRHYETDLDLDLEWTHAVDGIEIRARIRGSDMPIMDLVNRCDHCGRGDWDEAVCHTVEDAVRRGWLREAP